jgi:hypothetical protein
MSLPASIPAAIVDTILGRLAALFLIGANGNVEAARQAVLHLLAGYNIQTDQELFLAAEVISFGCYSLEALSQSATPDMPLNKVIRLRASAVSLNRESHRSRLKLEQMQRGRAAGVPAPQPAGTLPEEAPQRPSMDQAVELVDIAREAIETAGKNAQQGKYGGMTYAPQLQNRMTAKRMVEKAKRKAAEDNARIAAAERRAQAAAVAAQGAVG